MTRRLSVLSAIAATALMGLLAACGDDTGNVTVTWSIGVSGTCSEAQIVTVTVSLIDSGGDVVATGQTSCGEMRLHLSGVAEGTYLARVEGKNGEGNVVYSDEVEGVSVTKGGDTPVPARLLQAPGRIRLRWSFPGGRMCLDPLVNVDEIRAEVFTSMDTQVTFASGADRAPCSSAVLELTGEMLVGGDYSLIVTGYRGTMPAFQETIMNVHVAPATVADVTAVMEACADISGGCH